MPYISNPVYCGVGTVDAAEASAVARSTKFANTFATAYDALSKMSTAEKEAVFIRVKAVLDQMPYAQMENHIQIALKAAKVLDPRGLGQVSALTTTAKIASIIASLTTTGLGVAQFIQARKVSKDQQDAAQSQQALVEQQMQLQIDAQKQANAAQAAKQKQDQLNAAGLTVDAQGNVVKKSSLPTIAAIAAAGAGAFFLAK
jgi:hypothetical protein